ncbi:MAG: DUF4149 domain-containing protein [Rubrivivax sp.]
MKGAAVASRARRLLPAAWLGWMLCLAAVGAPSAFALLARADAGRVVARMLAAEAYSSLAFGLLLLVLERLAARHAVLRGQGRQFSPGMMLSLGALFCTVAGYFALLPLMEQARAGQGAFGFGQLHATSAVFFGFKVLLVAALAWRGSAPVVVPGLTPTAAAMTASRAGRVASPTPTPFS